jgi:hypothetical protein
MVILSTNQFYFHNMNEQELKRGLTKLYRATVSKKFGEKYSNIEVVDIDYEPSLTDIDDDGNWIEGDSYHIMVKLSSDKVPTDRDEYYNSDFFTIKNYLIDLTYSLVGKKNWIGVDFVD